MMARTGGLLSKVCWDKGSPRRRFTLTGLKTTFYLSFLFSLLLLLIVTFGYGFTRTEPTVYVKNTRFKLDDWRFFVDLKDHLQDSSPRKAALSKTEELSKAVTLLTTRHPIAATSKLFTNTLKLGKQHGKDGVRVTPRPNPKHAKGSGSPWKTKNKTAINPITRKKPQKQPAPPQRSPQVGSPHLHARSRQGGDANSSKVNASALNSTHEISVVTNSTILHHETTTELVSIQTHNGTSIKVKESFWTDIPHSFPAWVRFGLHWSGDPIAKGQPHWQAVGSRVEAFVYSAHFDTMAAPPMIRVIALLHKMISVVNVTCRYYDSAQAPSVHSVSGTLYHSRGLNGRKYVGAYVDCPLAADSEGYLPYAVSISMQKGEDTVTNFMIVHYSQKDTPTRQRNASGSDTSSVHPSIAKKERRQGKTKADWTWNITRCFPAIQMRFNDHVMLTEMVAASMAMGVQRFVFYVQSAGPDLWRMLKTLEKKGLAEVYPWNLHLVGNTVFYAAQSSAIQECFYRHLSSSRFLLFGDIDELFVPRKHKALLPLLTEVFDEKSKCGSVNFRNVFFDLNHAPKPPPPALDPSGYASSHQLRMLTRTRRIARVWPSPRRTKPAADPRRVITPGIHSVETLRKGYKLCVMEPGRGLLHHYRVITPKQSGPTREMEDTYLWQYAPDTIRRFQDLVQEFQKQPG